MVLIVVGEDDLELVGFGWVVGLDEDDVLACLEVAADTEVAEGRLQFGVEVLVIIFALFPSNDGPQITMMSALIDQSLILLTRVHFLKSNIRLMRLFYL